MFPNRTEIPIQDLYYHMGPLFPSRTYTPIYMYIPIFPYGTRIANIWFPSNAQGGTWM